MGADRRNPLPYMHHCAASTFSVRIAVLAKSSQMLSERQDAALCSTTKVCMELVHKCIADHRSCCGRCGSRQGNFLSLAQMHRKLAVFASFRPNTVLSFELQNFVLSIELQKYKHSTQADALPATRSGINTNLTFFGIMARALHWHGKQCHLLQSPCMQPQCFLGCPHQSAQQTWLLASSYHQTLLSDLLIWVPQVSLLCTL